MVNTATVSTFFALLALGAQAFVVLALVVGLGGRGLSSLAPARRWLVSEVGGRAVPLAWGVAAVATAGSLYYSEVAGFEPCELCWYQRIAMYPLVVVLGVAAVRRDRPVTWYALPLVGVGGLLSLYHYVLQRFPSLDPGACEEALPCSLTWVWRFHYLSIPLMALSAFALIAVLLGLDLASRREEPDRKGAPSDVQANEAQEIPVP